MFKKHISYTRPYLLTLNPQEEMNVLMVASSGASGYVCFGADKLCEKAEFKKIPFSYDSSLCILCAKLENLPSGKIFYNCTLSENEEQYTTDTYFFNTDFKSGYKFCALGDIKGEAGATFTCYNAGNMHPDFAIFTGNLCKDSTKAECWFPLFADINADEAATSFFGAISSQKPGSKLSSYAPLFPAVSKNDDKTAMREIFAPLFENGFNYDFVCADTHFFALDGTDLSLSEKFLEEKLSASRSAHKYVFIHPENKDALSCVFELCKKFGAILNIATEDFYARYQKDGVTILENSFCALAKQASNVNFLSAEPSAKLEDATGYVFGTNKNGTLTFKAMGCTADIYRGYYDGAAFDKF